MYHAIWNQRQGAMLAFVHLVSDGEVDFYQFNIYHTEHGVRTLVRTGNTGTLAEAKNIVLNFLGSQPTEKGE